jgi:hypothetical protein
MRTKGGDYIAQKWGVEDTKMLKVRMIVADHFICGLKKTGIFRLDLII